MISKKISPLLVALVATATASSAWALPAATGTSTAEGNYKYTAGSVSSKGSAATGSSTGAAVDVNGGSGGFGFEASAEAVGGALKAFASTSAVEGVSGKSKAEGYASFTDYVTFTGGVGSAEGFLLSSLSGSLNAGDAGKAKYEYTVSIYDLGSGAKQALIDDERTFKLGELTLSNAYKNDFSFTFGNTYKLVASLTATAWNGGVADFSHTANLNFALGSGVNLTSASGYTYNVPAVPEPQTYAMLLAGLGMISVMARRRTKM
ncbi:PEP-CTERM sorting domain-containing protein [Niveibacterium sp. 24ML]|uniref:PEP-CTERM sorting domain-containing protein n=1 Tax=Niveibacterium sp. 24ML TaxID=2985512 RepID=UPI00226F8192|nr:PEP-CTERM sorting domain-containing protein [Niveibacterium sp. 24ML]MCX9155810.1 PEP-CTERM sorting domain-containing protein [Niveibacterium sp. 24ML]